ncbi:restriction endonuclease subunit S [Staphylococcus hominis]|uniref:restriction endonuclease subunit S n=1 Tax=Staphylococcus hominis TaxID=1290 RepID=UPI001F59A03E|nr:restriction endonuclease subunit S [Staphylococcus hominis]MCI2916336.1 restriction endonuclease subunit S [Staphylococcus hominis]
MTEQINTPELRFPEFSYVWKSTLLGDVSYITKLAGFEFTKYVNYSNKGKVPAIRGLNVKNGRFNFKELKYIDDSDFSKLSRSKLLPKDIVFTYVGTIGNAAIVPNNTNWYLAPNVAKIRSTNVDPKFLLQILINPNFKRREIFSWITTSSQPALSMSNIRNFKLYLPSIMEQEKLGEFFSKLDRQIELEEEKLELLEQQKKGYMQKIFSQQLRFKDENGNDYPKWENKLLGNLVNITMGQSPSSKNYTENSNYTTLVQGNADLNNGYIQPRIYTKQITKLAEVNDILLTVRAPVGKIGRAQLKACIGRGVCAIKGDSFIYYFLELFDLQNKWIRFSQGSTFESISGNEIKNIDIAYPINEERQKISEFLSKLDELLKNQLLKVEQLKQRKQGLLQKMFI